MENSKIKDEVLAIGNLSLEEKIGQMFMIGFNGLSIPNETENFINDKNIGGVILFSRNINRIEDLVKLNNDIHSLGKISPMIWTDQEGGSIVRFGEMAATGISPMGITSTGKSENAKIIASIIARDMKKVGIDGVFAPVLDVNTNSANPVIGIRAFSDKTDTVIEYGREFIKGLNEENIASCGKHFPGHGAASADSHLEIPEIDISKKEFEEESIIPFLELADNYDSVMTAHVKYPKISEEIGTFSKEFISRRLKEENCFKGVVFSDCLEMKAIADNFSSEEIIFKSIDAGIDIMIISHTYRLQKKYYEIALKMARKGEISETRINDSVIRILNLKKKYKIDKFKQRKIITGKEMRLDIDKEEKIAMKSIKVIKEESNTLPLSENSKVLFIEFTKSITGPSVLSSRKISKFKGLIKGEFKFGDFLSFSLSNKISKIRSTIIQAIQKSNYNNIVIFIYSFPESTRVKLIETIKNISRFRDDLIVISLENPYEIDRLPFIKTFICSYGFRNIQIQASLKTLKLYRRENP